MSKIKTILYGAVALAAGCFMTYNGIEQRQKQALLDKEGVEVPGEAQSGEVKTGRRGSKSQKIDVQWQSQDGKPHLQTFRVSKDFFAGMTDGHSITKPAVTVRYAPTDSDGTAIVVGGSSHNPEMIWVGLGAGVIGLGLCTYGVKRRD